MDLDGIECRLKELNATLKEMRGALWVYDTNPADRNNARKLVMQIADVQAQAVLVQARLMIVATDTEV